MGRLTKDHQNRHLIMVPSHVTTSNDMTNISLLTEIINL